MAVIHLWDKLRRRVKRMGDKHHGAVHPLLSSAMLVAMVGITVALAVYAMEVK